jgi:hypothetical protein
MSFTGILDELQEMHDRKNRDYGIDSDPYRNVRASEDFGIPAWVGALIRANDKMRRLMKAAQGGELVNESIEDSFLDLATYVGIGLDLYRQAQQKAAPRPLVEQGTIWADVVPYLRQPTPPTDGFDCPDSCACNGGPK